MDQREFSLIHGDLPSRIQQRLGLMPVVGLRVGRRAFGLALASWLPIWAGTWIFDGGSFGATGEPLAVQYDIHVRCLVALPMLIIAEQTLDTMFARCLRQLQKSQIVPRDKLETLLHKVAALRDCTLPWVCIIALSVTWSLDTRLHEEFGLHDQSSPLGAAQRARVGTLWYAWVVVPVFSTLLLGWLWRLALWAYALICLSRLPMMLVPTHPDGAFGLGFLERAPFAFAPLLFGVSSVLGANWAHQMLIHNQALLTFRGPALIFVTIAMLPVLLPLLAFAAPLYRAKVDALPDYAALVGEHGRKVRQRWVLQQEPREASLLHAPELGALADTLVLFERVTTARVVPIGKSTLVVLGISLGLPLLAAALCRVPLLDVLRELQHILM
jgi:hypothetical protein